MRKDNKMSILRLKSFYVIFFLGIASISYANQIPQWQKDVYKKTRNVKRISPEMAYQMYLTGKSFFANVDPATFYQRKRIVESTNIPWTKFTENFIKRNKSKFKKYKYIIVC